MTTTKTNKTTTMYRYSDRDTHGQMAPDGAAERVLLEVINVVRFTSIGTAVLDDGNIADSELIENYDRTLAGARQKFLRLKMAELRECQREQMLIALSINEMLVKQPGEE